MNHGSVFAHSKNSKRIAVALIFASVIFFALGVAGHRQLHNGWSDSLYKTLQLFHLHYHPHPDGAEPNHAPPPGILEVARFGAGLAALALLPTMLGFLFAGPIGALYVRLLWKNHVIVYGHCLRTLSFIRDLASSSKKVVFVGKCPVPLTELPAGVHLVEDEISDRERQLKNVAIRRASHLVILTESDRDNLEILVAAEAACDAGRRPAGLGPLECYVHLADTHLGSSLYRSLTSTAGHSGVRRQIFNYYDLAARLLVWRHPIPEPMAEPVGEHFIIVGFGAFGQCVALRLLKNSQQLQYNGREWSVRKPRITIIDPRGEAIKAAFLRTNPQFTDLCELTVLEHDCEDAAFVDLQFLKPEVAPTRTSIIYALENEVVTLRSALMAMDAGRQRDKDVDFIYVRIAHPERLGPLLDEVQSAHADGPRLVFFAPDGEIFSANVLLNQGLDDLAREVHDAYLAVEAKDRRENNLPPAAGTRWEELSEDDRQSNREAADHTCAKLHMLGFQLRPLAADEPLRFPDPKFLNAINLHKEKLARTEHFRWMTWRVLNGWSYGSPRDNARKLHPDIVEYEQLNESTKEKDRIIVDALPKMLTKGRFEAMPTGVGR